MNRQILAALIAVALVTGVAVLRSALTGSDEFMARIRDNAQSDSMNFSVLNLAARSLVLKDPVLTKRERSLATLGRKLFFDAGLSENGQVSCATCHNPDLFFTDGLPVSRGIALTDRNAPSVVNSFAMFWFFWDGRADSLAAQALGPLENSKEHGLTRSEVVRHVLTRYRDEYQELFGPVPESFLSGLPGKAAPAPANVQVSKQLAGAAVASVTDPDIIRKIAQDQNAAGTDIRLVFSDAPEFSDAAEQAAASAYAGLTILSRNLLDEAFANIGLAIEAFEKGLVANESSFDRFAKNWAGGAPERPEEHFSADFSAKELLGLQIFLGKGGCNFCHTGANFSDSQFHNIGLPQRGEAIELGRSTGMLKVMQDQFNCQGVFAGQDVRRESESCYDLPYLNKDSPEGIGSFKTPSLRNVAKTAPYMRDGRMTSLRQVLEHYNRMDTLSAVGFREETLAPLQLDEFDLEALESFLNALSSPVRDLTATETPAH